MVGDVHRRVFNADKYEWSAPAHYRSLQIDRERGTAENLDNVSHWKEKNPAGELEVRLVICHGRNAVKSSEPEPLSGEYCNSCKEAAGCAGKREIKAGKPFSPNQILRDR